MTAAREKEGRTGPLTFVTVRNEYRQGGELLVLDEYDIVYRSGDSGALPAVGEHQEMPDRSPRLNLTADEALRLRFSALTYNAHRIHYDHNWVKREGYDDLVVHGPLQALMMGELFRRAGEGLLGRTYSCRLVAPMIGPQPFTVMAGDNGIESSAEVRAENGAVTAVSTVSPSR